MSSVFLAPHCDDESLFGAYLICREDPVVVVVFGIGDSQEGVPAKERSDECVAACHELEVGVLHQWQYRETEPDWLRIRTDVFDLAERFDHCFAPAVEPGGQTQHNEVGHLAESAFGPDRLTGYLTYTTGGVRSTWGEEHEPESEWVFRKLAALSCYRSQARTPSIVHFQDPLREWVA